MKNERRLIDANALSEELSTLTMIITGLRAGKGVLREYMTEYRKSVLRIVDEQPTVDAVEVVHGRWECAYDEIMGETEVICSNCKDTRTINGCFVTTEGESCYFEDNYCPNCGAKMDLKGGMADDL